MDGIVRLSCAGVKFGSYLDEKHLFAWAEELSCFERWDGDTLVIRTQDMSEADLRDILALPHTNATTGTACYGRESALARSVICMLA